jgi:hypothetical protein
VEEHHGNPVGPAAFLDVQPVAVADRELVSGEGADGRVEI